MPSVILTMIHAAQAVFGAYNLYLASISINNLQGYEESSKKAARYSNTAAHQLHKTRTTQASGAVAVLVSFLSSVSSIFYGPSSGPVKLLLAVVNIAVLEGARRHVGGFWEGKAKIPLPGLGDHNEAAGKTLVVRLNMTYLIASWVGAGVLSLVL